MKKTFILLFIVAASLAYALEDPPCILFDSSYGRCLPGSSGDVGLWWASSGWKISQDRPLPKRGDKTMIIRLAQNETEAAQLVIQPKAALTGFLAKPGVLRAENGTALPETCVEVLRVRYVKVERPTDPWGAAGMWPDPLPPFSGPIALAAGKNQPLWVRVHAPKGTPPGEYRGVIDLTAQGYHAAAPLTVQVYGFELPDKMTCETAFGFSAGNIDQYQGIKDPADHRAVLEKYWSNLRAHHITPYHPESGAEIQVQWVKQTAEQAQAAPEADRALLMNNAITPVFDFTAWDAEMQRVRDLYHFSTFRLGMQGMGDGGLQGFGPDTREFKLAFTAYAQGLQEHLREKGWLDSAYIYWTDEPSKAEYPYVMNTFRRLKEAAPDLRRMLTEQVENDLIGGPNLWCPMTSTYKHDRAQERRADGDHFWWYICTVPKRPYAGLFIDHPGIDLRMWLWQTWQYGVEGVLVWQTNLWTTSTAYPDKPQNPYEDPMSWMVGYGTKAGEKKPWGNGDGRFLYPPESCADAQPAAPVLDGPVDSIRWEMLRDGIEDYEYLAMLKHLIDAQKEPRAQKRYGKLLEVPETISVDVKNYTKDPAALEARRHKVAEAIERLMNSESK